MTYLAIVLAVVCIAIVNVCLMVYAFIRVKNRVPSTRDQVVGFLLAGPLFFFIDRQLRKREYKLSRFEYYGLLFVSATVLVIIMGAIVTTFFKLPV